MQGVQANTFVGQNDASLPYLALLPIATIIAFEIHDGRCMHVIFRYVWLRASVIMCCVKYRGGHDAWVFKGLYHCSAAL